MPHIIIEHSADIQSDQIITLEKSIQKLVGNIEGNFDPDQCKARALSFNEYLVGKPDQSTSSFIHVTFKLLDGRSLVVRESLSKGIADLTSEFIANQSLKTLRCDISVDIVEMDSKTYQKLRIE